MSLNQNLREMNSFSREFLFLLGLETIKIGF